MNRNIAHRNTGNTRSPHMVRCRANTGQTTTRTFMALPNPMPITAPLLITTEPEPNNGRPASSGNSFGGNQQYGQPQQDNPFGPQYGPGSRFGSSQPNGQSQQPHYYNGIDLNDPNQNPLYGHWDSYAIISFVLAMFFPVPVLSALMGGVAMWRTRTFHMKGFGLALAAVVINVFYTLVVIWMALNGYDAMTLYQDILQQFTGSGTGPSSDSISA